MTPERWRRIDEIFQSATDLAPAQRNAFLDEHCAGDDELRAEVESLLDAQGLSLIQPAVEAAAAEWSAMSAAPADSFEGRTIGPYRILERLGQGGMGVVYRGVRAGEEFQQEVALKIIRPELAHSQASERFLAERRILASLEHPFIARLIDGGSHEGLPYLVMEYAQSGLPIDAYCRERKLSTRARLEIFLKVCEAVAYAHHHLTVHRDLKPGNIFVLPDGRPKLLDFGIARLLEDDAGAAAASGLTQTGWLLMTPDYASPEQVSGGAITVASDVYSLGVILYELLTGERPYRLKSYAPAEIQQLVCTLPVTAPSGVVTRASRLRRALEGDLDNILLMALRKEPERRYASVEQMADDIRRHLDGLTVIARPDTFTYRTGKFLRRHRIAVVLAAALVLSIAAGAFFTFREGIRAQRRFNQVRSLATAILTDFDPEARRLPGSVKLRQMMVDQSLLYLDHLSAEAGDDPALRAELASAYHRIADILGYPRIPNLGRLQQAVDNHSKALAIEESLRRSSGDSPKLLRELALGYAHVGEIQMRQGNSDLAEKNVARALALARPEDRDTYLMVRLNWNRLRFFAGDVREAMRIAEEALPLALTIDNPALAGTFYHAVCQAALELGLAPRALMNADTALRLMDSKRARFGDDITFRLREAALLEMRAGALGGTAYPNQGRHCEAADLLRKVAELESSEYTGNAANRNSAPNIAGTALETAGAIALCGHEDATPEVQRAIEAVGGRERATQPEFTVGLARAQWKQGRVVQALAFLQPLLQSAREDIDALEIAARIEFEAGREAQALNLLGRARRLRAPALSTPSYQRETHRFDQAANLALALQHGDPTPGLAAELGQLVAAWPAEGLAASLDWIRAVAAK